MAANVALANKVMEYIEANPEEYDPTRWAIRNSCGTACCFAGRTVMMTGWELIFGRHGDDDELTAAWCSQDGEVRFINEVATEELGLTEGEADELFDAGNSCEKLRSLVDAITVRES